MSEFVISRASQVCYMIVTKEEVDVIHLHVLSVRRRERETKARGMVCASSNQGIISVCVNDSTHIASLKTTEYLSAGLAK